jgi:hypothetical protein
MGKNSHARQNMPAYLMPANEGDLVRLQVTTLTILVGMSLAGCEKLKPAPEPRETLERARLAIEACNIGSFLQLMAPHMRAELDADTIARAEERCRAGNDQDMQTTALVFQTAEALNPTFDKNGTLAVYDMKGFGFPKKFEEIRLMKVGEEWFFVGK